MRKAKPRYKMVEVRYAVRDSADEPIYRKTFHSDVTEEMARGGDEEQIVEREGIRVLKEEGEKFVAFDYMRMVERKGH